MYASKYFFPVTLSCLLAVAPAMAADKKADPNKEQIRRMQQAQRKLEQEKQQVEQEKAALATSLEEAKAKADTEARRAAGLQRELGILRTARDTLSSKLADTEGELRKWQEQQRAAEAEGKRLQQVLAAEKQSHQTCVARNQEMHKTSLEVLALYEKKGCSDSLLQREPLIGLRRVQMENAIEDLSEKLDSQRISK